MPAQGRRLETVLFLDMVGSTAVAARLGDARWRGVLTAFNRAVRMELKRFDGHEEDTAGDGFFATFTQPTAAVRCGCAIVEKVRELGLEVRVGIHTGETELIDGKRGGLGVVIGARVMSLGGAGEVLVTSTTKDLVAGSGMEFESLVGARAEGRPGHVAGLRRHQRRRRAAGVPAVGRGGRPPLGAGGVAVVREAAREAADGRRRRVPGAGRRDRDLPRGDRAEPGDGLRREPGHERRRARAARRRAEPAPSQLDLLRRLEPVAGDRADERRRRRQAAAPRSEGRRDPLDPDRADRRRHGVRVRLRVDGDRRRDRARSC